MSPELDNPLMLNYVNCVCVLCRKVLVAENMEISVLAVRPLPS
jgi:hypothetical protein